MMILPVWYAIVFGLALIAFPILLLYCIYLYPNYSIFTRTISGLGNPDYKSAKIFNPTIFIMGFVLLPFPYFVLQVLPTHWMTTIGIMAFFFNPIGLILVGLFPEHKNIPHMIAATFAMGGILIANIALVYPIFLSDLSIITVIISSITLFTCWPLFISAIKYTQSYTPDQPIDNILFNVNFWEWIQFIVLQTWISVLYINLLFLS